MKSYTGTTANQYEKKRKNNPIWRRENGVMVHLLDNYSDGTSVLDIPVGTGRFLKFYADRGFNCVGADISHDMLDIAYEKKTQYPLIEANVFDIPFEDNHFDLCVCVRLLTWFTVNGMRDAVKELTRVTRKGIICSVWVGDRKNPPGTIVVNRESEWNDMWNEYDLSIYECYPIKTTKIKEYRVYHIGLDN